MEAANALALYLSFKSSCERKFSSSGDLVAFAFSGNLFAKCHTN